MSGDLGDLTEVTALSLLKAFMSGRQRVSLRPEVKKEKTDGSGVVRTIPLPAFLLEVTAVPLTGSCLLPASVCGKMLELDAAADLQQCLCEKLSKTLT